MTRRDAILGLTSAVLPHADYLLMDVPTKRLTRNEWPDAGRTLDPGSLLKPFLALAYGAAHDFCFPVLTCTGCWKRDGHGRLALVEAIAYSCNSYFLQLARACPKENVARVAATFGLPAPAADAPETWIGLKGGWPVSPVDLLGAYAELRLRALDPGPRLILQGMRMSAKQGTGRGIHAEAYVKTGTGPCRHSSRGSGDGYALALLPTGSAGIAVLAGLHNSPGSEAAKVAGRIVRQLAPGEI